MGRLIAEALYSNEMVGEHYIRNFLRGEVPFCDTTDYAGIWERAAQRIKIIDPTGKKSSALLRQVMAGAEEDKR
jgi:hypothetical protein